MEQRAMLWERLDTSGKDACRVVQQRDEWVIQGTAVFEYDITVACLSYSVICASDWSTESAKVSGWVGSQDIELDVRRSDHGNWVVNGDPIPNTADLLDIDLGFTPASNTSAIRRLELTVGEDIGTTALWLDSEDWSLKPLYQTYRRTSPTTYDYSSPSHDYTAELTTDDFGLVLSYPELWASSEIPTTEH